jgi:glutaredoxin
MPVTVYTTKTCAYCPQVKRLLTLKGIEYEEVDISNDQPMRQALYKATGAMTVPITTDGEMYVIGWKPAELMKLIRKQNKEK